MKTARMLIRMTLASALLSSGCKLPAPTARSGETLHVASGTESVAVAGSARAVVGGGSAYWTYANAVSPGVVLEQGKLLLVKNKDGEVCDIVAGPARARLLGTTVLVEKRGSLLRVINVEGRTRVNWGNRLGEYRMLRAGEMLLVDEKAKTLPVPVLVDLARLVGREELLSGKFLGSEKLALIDIETKEQAARLVAGRLQQRGSFYASTLQSIQGQAEGDGINPKERYTANTLQSIQGQAAQRNARAIDTRINTLAGALSGGSGTQGAVRALAGLSGAAVQGVQGTVQGVQSTVQGGVQGTVQGVQGAVQGVQGAVQGVQGTVQGVQGTVQGATGAVGGVVGGLIK